MLLCVEQKMKKGNIYTWITSAKIHKKLMTMIASGDRGGWGGQAVELRLWVAKDSSHCMPLKKH